MSTTIKSKKEVLGSRSSSNATRSNGSKLSDSMQSVVELSLETQGADRTAELLEQLADKLRANQHELPRGFNTPYVNTIPVEAQTPYPGDWKTEVRLKSLMRWNAMAMVVKANSTTNVGGHIASYASSATLYEVAFNHFFRGRTENFPGDAVYFQGHAAPGVYARAFLEGRITEKHLLNFRQELAEGGQRQRVLGRVHLNGMIGIEHPHQGAGGEQRQRGPDVAEHRRGLSPQHPTKNRAAQTGAVGAARFGPAGRAGYGAAGAAVFEGRNTLRPSRTFTAPAGISDRFRSLVRR